MLTLPLLFQICAARYYGVLTGHLHISHLKKMCTTVFSTVLFFHLVVTNMSATPPTPLSSTQAPESACQTHSSAARVGRGAQLLGGSVMVDAWLGAGAASSPPAPGPPTGRLQAPPAPSSPWRSLRRGTAGHSAATWPQMRGLQPASSAWRRTFPPPAVNLVGHRVGIVEEPSWRSGDSVPTLVLLQLQQQQLPQQKKKLHQQQQLPAV